jgi:murein DD-endopeptidase MepM/ murein hydrolase activator NlpD
MNIVFFSQQKGQIGCFTLTRRRAYMAAFAALVVFPAAFIYAGFQIAQNEINRHIEQDPVASALHKQMLAQKRQVKVALQDAEDNLNALALQMGKMQARVIRLDAMGRRLTNMAGLNKGEFDFADDPAQGGPVDASNLQDQSVPDFLGNLKELSKQLDDRTSQLSVLELMLMNRNLQEDVLPAGRPIKKGWISSYYGMRTDPFTGKRERHDGMDFAGKAGTPVRAVAAGVVTWASDRYGYGNLVEVNHGNGYVTRYGHNRKILVKVGQKVEKGAELAEMGSTGRSTGPHVHFEVIKNGHTVNPEKYIQAKR